MTNHPEKEDEKEKSSNVSIVSQSHPPPPLLLLTKGDIVLPTQAQDLLLQTTHTNGNGGGNCHLFQAPYGIQWTVEEGATVVRNQLIGCIAPLMVEGTSKLSSSSLTDVVATNTFAMNGTAAQDNVTVKPKIIRARKRQRKIVKKTNGVSSDGNGNGTKLEHDMEDPKRNGTMGTIGSLLKGHLKKNVVSSTSSAFSSKRSISPSVSVSVPPPKNDIPHDKSNKKVPEKTLNTSSSNSQLRIPIHAPTNGFLHKCSTLETRLNNTSSSSSSSSSSPLPPTTTCLILAHIEPCTHPTVVGGLCVVCGQPVITTHSQSSSSQHKSLTVSGGITVQISSEGASSEQSQTSRALHQARKLHLVLDLDHTLLHATADVRAQEYSQDCQVKVILLPLMEGNPLFPSGGGSEQFLPHFVKLRPHLAEFLVDLMPLFEITIYTAGTRGYAEKICNVMARHVLDYLKMQKQQRRQKEEQLKSNGAEEIQDKKDLLCLDEGELQILRTHISKTQERLTWFKNKKDRQDYMKKINQKFLEEKAKKEASQDNGEKRTKRRRVCFEESIPLSQDTTRGESDDTSKNGIEKLIPKKVNKEEDLGEDPTELLKELKCQLKAAEEMEKEALLLRKKIFGSRIISRTDVTDLGKDVKSIKRVFPCGGMMAAIVDDREDVWANAVDNSTGRQGEPPDNLLLVRPYHWEPFRNFADINNVSGEDLGALDDRTSSKDGIKVEKDEVQLLWTKDILKKLHNTYYDTSLTKSEREKLSAPEILKRMRRQVFSRPQVKVLLSGLVPLEKQDPSSSRGKQQPRPNYIRYAEELGAQVVNDVTPQITHVIAARDGTDKVIRSRGIPGCVIVRESWLMECYRSISRMDTHKHLLGLKPLPPSEKLAPTKLLLSGSDGSEEDEDDDDEFFADFEKKLQQRET